MGTGQKPTHKLSIVRDGANDRDQRWMTLAHLWPTKNGEGYSGEVQLAAPVLLPAAGVRFVISEIQRNESTATEDEARTVGDDDVPF
jgi:hypothetical protein